MNLKALEIKCPVCGCKNLPRDITIDQGWQTRVTAKAEGSRCLLNLLTRIRLAFLRDGSIADRYLLKISKEQPLEIIVYPDSTATYYLGEMMTEWTLPTVNLEPPFAAGYNGNIPTVESEVEERW